MIKRFAITITFALLALSRPALALEQKPDHIEPGTLIDEKHSPTHAASEGTRDEADHPKVELHYTHPNLPPYYATWAGAMVMMVAGMFVAAAVIGPIIRSEMSEEVPDAHSHDEPHSTSAHH